MTPKATPKAAKRDRKRQNKQAASAARAAEMARRKRQRTTRRFTIIGGAVAAILILLAVKSSGGGGKGDKVSATNFATSCPSVVTSGPKTFAAAPKLGINKNKKYVAKFETDAGTFIAQLDAKQAPVTVNNFVYLACQGFYDGVPFHRVVDNFVIQAGDPQCTDAELAKPDGKCGQAGPGYTIAEEPPKDGKYPEGSLAMAKTGAPHSTGSQFFVVTGDPSALESAKTYSWFGKVTSGLDVAKKIEKQHGPATGSGQFDGPPSPPVHIKKLRITES